MNKQPEQQQLDRFSSSLPRSTSHRSASHRSTSKLKNHYYHELAQRCHEEHTKFKRGQAHDPSYGYTLFRHALEEQDEQAWETVYHQYKNHVQNWIYKHPCFSLEEEDISHFINLSFERMWRAITPEKFAKFSTLSQILHYLKRCVDGTLRDHYRKVNQRVSCLSLDKHFGDEPHPYAQTPAIDITFDAFNTQQERWAFVVEQARTMEEKLFIQALMDWGLKPRQMCETFPDVFKCPKDVNRVRSTFIGRLRRLLEKELFC